MQRNEPVARLARLSQTASQGQQAYLIFGWEYRNRRRPEL